LEIVGEVADEANPRPRPEVLARPLVVTPPKTPATARHCDTLFRHFPELRIIAVAPTRNHTVCYWASVDIHSGDIESSEEGFAHRVRQHGGEAGRCIGMKRERNL